MAKRIYSDDLKQTLIDHPGIEFVHFTTSGDHYFNVHRDDTNNGKLYGRTERVAISNESKSGIKDGSTMKNIGVASTLIVESVERDIILAAAAEEQESTEVTTTPSAQPGTTDPSKEEKKK
jgi:hypothetical protein